MTNTLTILRDPTRVFERDEVLFYPFPMHLAQGLTYHISILQFLQAVSRRIPVFLVTLDDGDALRDFFLKEFGEEMSDKVHLVQARQRRFGVRSNRIWFSRDVVSSLKLVQLTFSRVYVLTRNVKQMLYLLRRRGGGPKTSRCVYVFECHQLFSQNLAMQQFFFRALQEARYERALYSKVDLVFVNTFPLAHQVSTRFHVPCSVLPVSASTRDVLPHPPDCESFLLREYDFVYAGSYSPWKGVETFLDAAALLRDRFSWKGSALLLGVGGANHEAFEQKLCALGLTRHVVLHPRVRRWEVASILDQARIGVIPNSLIGDSVYNTSPLKIFDYSARALHIVASRIPALDGAVDSGVVHWARPDDPNDWAHALNRAISAAIAPNLAGLEWAKGRTWAARADNALEAVRTLIRQ